MNQPQRISARRPTTSLALLAVLAVIFWLTPLRVTSAAAASHPSSAAQRTCHWVVKKSHGHKKRVRVCTPTPTPTPSPTTTPTPSPTPTPSADDQLAAGLANAVTSASTPDARTQALDAVMSALHLPVISPSGAILVKGYLRSPQDLLLYSFELQAIAGGLQRKQLATLSDVSALLQKAGITQPGGSPLAAETLRQILLSGTRDAEAHPADSLSLVPLLVRDLGLRHDQPYDLVTDVPAAALQLDTLQELLVVADLTYPEIQQHPSVAAAGDLRRSFAGILRPHPLAAEDPCTSQLSQLTGGTLPFGKWGLALIPKIGGVAGAVTGVLDMIHGMMLAYSVKVTAASPELQSTHEGPAGHAPDAGKVLRFSVKVEMQDDYGDTLVNCGTMAGFTLPKPGPIAGVPIVWEQALGDLAQYGTVTYDPADHKTGSDGIASLVFTPKDEKFPGFGTEKDARGTLNGTALYQSALGNVSGGVVQYLTPKYAGMAWEVTYHKSQGFTFANARWGWHTQGGSVQVTASGRICGEDPYGTWNVSGQQTSTVDGEGSQTVPGQVSVALEEGQASSFGPSGYPVTMQFVAGPSPHVVFGVSPAEGGFAPDAPSVSVPVQEDLTCPAAAP